MARYHFAILDEDSINVVQGGFRPDIFESCGHGVGLTRIGVLWREQERSSVGKHSQVRLPLRDEHVANEDVEVSVSVHVPHGWGSPCSVRKRHGVFPWCGDVGWGSGFAIEAVQPPAKGHQQLCGSVPVHIQPQGWSDGDLVVIVPAPTFHRSTPLFDRWIVADVVAPCHALSVEAGRR